MSDKIFFSFIVTFFLFSFNSFAEPIKFNLSAEHGSELKSADFPIRYKFEKETGYKWNSSTYSQREAFLSDWHKNQSINELNEAAEKAAALKSINEKNKENKELTRNIKEKDRIKKEALRAEMTSEKNKKRAFNQTTRNQELKVRKLRQLQKQNKRSLKIKIKN